MNKHINFKQNLKEIEEDDVLNKQHYIYPINKIVVNDYKKIKLQSLKYIFFCIFQINTQQPQKNKSHFTYPFIQYLLWKYPKNNKKNSDLFVFPFQKYDQSKTIIQIEKDILKKMNIKSVNYNKIGFIQVDDKVYLFYKHKYIYNFPCLFLRNEQMWWCTIDEICNKKRILNFPIHQSVTNLFYMNRQLIYLYEKNGRRYDTPTVAFYGGFFKKLPSIVMFGERKSGSKLLHGSNYYFGTYKHAIRRAGWTFNYKAQKIDNITIANEFGKYTQGGIIRYILFLGKMKCLLNQPLDKKILYENSRYKNKNTKSKDMSHLLPISKVLDYDSLWAINHHSLYYGRTKLIHNYPFRSTPTYVTHSYNQNYPLTMHQIDMSTLPTIWNPYLNKYYIK